MFRSKRLRAFVVATTLSSMIFAQARPVLAEEKTWKDKLSGYADDAWSVTKDKASGAWEYSKVKALEIGGVAKEKAIAAAGVSWVWAKAGANDAWDWVKEQTPTAKQWVADTAESTWLMTREKSGELYLWAKVKADESGATSYVRTTLDETWTWTTDTAGETWIWIKDHKVKVAVVVAIIGAIVVAYFTKGSAPPASLTQHYASTSKTFPNTVNRDQFGAIAHHAFDSRANGSNYRRVFEQARGKPLPAGFEVHHGHPQKYEALMKDAGMNIHNPYHLQGVDPATHVGITRDWATWKRNLAHPPKAEDVTSFKQTIDKKYADKLLELEPD